ncbi:hypothetical protein Clacol_010290 [Clathrus columnatus]|uniref:Uncharacterized protein n=1 Tax=Clathrus columnatus TaxID=1419009 RepID=A0AAV5AUM2_9AGAM|nr:hypothetical protein Clacol_010290 [Clathrus columnatus]
MQMKEGIYTEISEDSDVADDNYETCASRIKVEEGAIEKEKVSFAHEGETKEALEIHLLVPRGIIRRGLPEAQSDFAQAQKHDYRNPLDALAGAVVLAELTGFTTTTAALWRLSSVAKRPRLRHMRE